MRPIDADALMETFEMRVVLAWVKNIVNNAPTIDAVPVVRCLDCQNRYEYLFCGYMGDNDFCSAAHPRKDGADNG